MSSLLRTRFSPIAAETPITRRGLISAAAPFTRPASSTVAPLTRRGFLAAAGLALSSSALALVGCGGQAAGAATAASGSAATGSSGTGSLKKVRIGVPGTDNTLLDGGAIAEKEGFIAEELEKVGYEPEYLAFAQAGPAVNEAFSAGSIDITEYGDLPGYSAIAKGIPIKAFASGNAAMQFGIFASEASGVTDVQGLKGKKVVVGFGTVQHHYLLLALDKAGLKPTDLELVNSATDGQTMVAAGQADAYASALFGLYAIEGKVKGSVIADSLKDDDQSSTFLFFHRTQFAKENPEVAPAIVRALKRGYELARKDYDQGIKDIVTRSLTEEVARKVYVDDFKSLDPAITDDVKKKVEGLGTFMKDNQLVQKTVSTEEFFDLDPYKRAE